MTFSHFTSVFFRSIWQNAPFRFGTLWKCVRLWCRTDRRVAVVCRKGTAVDERRSISLFSAACGEEKPSSAGGCKPIFRLDAVFLVTTLRGQIGWVSAAAALHSLKCQQPQRLCDDEAVGVRRQAAVRGRQTT